MTGELFSRNTTYLDTDLTFLVHTYRDSVQLQAMLANVRSHYRQARVIVCSDGDPDPHLPQLAAQAEAEFFLGENLYSDGNGGKVCHRMLDLFLHRPTKYLFKVDPDTGFHRRFAYMPGHSGMFGTLQSSPLLCSIQGGCCGMTLDWAERMHAEKVFLDERLLDSSRTWATYAPLWGYMKKVKRVSSDWIFGYVATAIGCPQFGFAEVMSQWRKPVENPQLLYAVTHPVRKPSHHTDR